MSADNLKTNLVGLLMVKWHISLSDTQPGNFKA